MGPVAMATLTVEMMKLAIVVRLKIAILKPLFDHIRDAIKKIVLSRIRQWRCV